MSDEGPDYEDIFYNYEEMVAAFDNDSRCFLVALDSWSLALVQASLKYAHWPSRWEGLGQSTFEEVHQRVEKLENCLMSGCQVSDLVTAIDELKESLHTDMQALGGTQPLLDLTGLLADLVSMGGDMLQVYTALYYVAVLAGANPALLPPPPELP